VKYISENKNQIPPFSKDATGLQKFRFVYINPHHFAAWFRVEAIA
jgi:hypothetical protein